MNKRGIAPIILIVIAFLVVAFSVIGIIVYGDFDDSFRDGDSEIESFLKEKGIIPYDSEETNGLENPFNPDEGFSEGGSVGGGGGSGGSSEGGSGGGGDEGLGDNETHVLCLNGGDENYLYDEELEVYIFNRSSGVESFYIRDAESAEYLRQNFSNERFFSDLTDLLDITYDIKEICGGVDIVYSVTNPTSNGVALPTFRIDGLIQDTSSLNYLNTKDSGTMEDISIDPDDYTLDKNYPNWFYSPVIATNDGEKAVATSFIYPYLDYRNDIRVRLHRVDSGEQVGTMRHLYDASPEDSSDIYISAGETWNFNISLRFAESNEWIYTLYPYKNFFQGYYGAYDDVRLKDTRPVFKKNLVSKNHTINSSNPRGYNLDLRLHDLGWESFIDEHINFLQENGYERTNLWLPSGRYPDDVNEINFPPQFMDFLPHLEDSDFAFDRFSQEGIELGFWWGRADQVPDQIIPYWDEEDYPESIHVGNYSNSDDVDFMTSQLEQAVDREALTIGLDNFIRMPEWQRYLWVQDMKEIAPGVLFVGESSQPDFIHSEIGNWYYPERWGRNTQPGEDLLSEYIGNGDSEIWVQLKDEVPAQETIDQLIEWGFTPVIQHEEVNISTFLLSPTSECLDGLDNDNDGKIDFPYDSSCSNPEDKTEADALVQPDINKKHRSVTDYFNGKKENSKDKSSSVVDSSISPASVSLTGALIAFLESDKKENVVLKILIVIIILSVVFYFYYRRKNR